VFPPTSPCYRSDRSLKFLEIHETRPYERRGVLLQQSDLGLLFHVLPRVGQNTLSLAGYFELPIDRFATWHDAEPSLAWHEVHASPQKIHLPPGVLWYYFQNELLPRDNGIVEIVEPLAVQHIYKVHGSFIEIYLRKHHKMFN